MFVPADDEHVSCDLVNIPVTKQRQSALTDSEDDNNLSSGEFIIKLMDIIKIIKSSLLSKPDEQQKIKT